MGRTSTAIVATIWLSLFTCASAAQDGTAGPSAAQVVIAGPVLMVSDLERSLKFYVNGLGMKVARRLAGNSGPGAVVTSGDAATPFILLRQQSEEVARSVLIDKGSGLSRIMLSVTDVEATAARLDAAGYAHDPIGKTRIFFVKDPDGYRYEVMARSSRH